MKLAVLQFSPVTAACQSNAKTLLALVKQAAERGAELCIAPELAICGPNAMDFLLRRDFITECRSALDFLAEELARDSSLPALLLGAPLASPVPRGKQLHNCAVLLAEGKLSVVSRKVILPSDNCLNDAHYFDAGLFSGVLQYKGWRLVVTIGEDIGAPPRYVPHSHDLDPLTEVMQSGGGDVVINLANCAFTQEEPFAREMALAAVARQHHAPVVFANISGGYDSLVFYGGSCAVDKDTRIVDRAPYFQEDVFIVNLAELQKQGIPPHAEPVEEFLWNSMVLGTRDFGRRCGFSKAVLGVSGGIDSALVLAVAVEAFGAENVTGVLMPSPYSSEGSVRDSLELASRLGVHTVAFPITSVLHSFSETLAPVSGQAKGLTEENLQARIRGTLLMAYAGETQSMVLNTGNKSEAACGYSTLYGDSVGALCVIGDLYKLQVYDICRWLNSTRGNIIPGIILEKAPSAELSPGQRDTDSLPPYDILDNILKLLIEQAYSVDEITSEGYSRDVVVRIARMVQRARFKRQQTPTVLQLSKYALSSVWRTPIACAMEFN